MHKTILLRYTAFVFALTSLIASADTILLKNGEKIEGKILSESDTDMVVEIQETASIKDERSILKSEVDKIEKTSSDETAWKTLKAYIPGTESFPQQNYEQMIAALNAFAASYPASPHAAEAKEKAGNFQVELDRVIGGEIKLNNQWLAKEEVEKERVQLTAQMLFNTMKSQYGRGLFTDAMNSFDRMEKTAAGARCYPDAVDLAKKILPLLKDATTRQQAVMRARNDESRKRISQAKGPERKQLEQTETLQNSRIDATIKQMSAWKWPALNPSNENSLMRLSAAINAETMRLSYLNLEKMRDSIESAKNAANALKAKDIKSAEAAVFKAGTAWPANEQLAHLKLAIEALTKQKAEEVIQAYEAEAAKIKEEKARQAETGKALAKDALANPAPPPGPASNTAPKTQTPEEEPANWPVRIALTLITLALAASGYVAYKKFVAPENNILDQ